MPRDIGAIAVRFQPEERTIWSRLQTLPNIGPAMAYDLLRLGIRQPSDLARQDPDTLYEELGRLDGVRHDPCVRDVFAAVISYANTGDARPWWEFTPERKIKERGV